MKFLCWILDHRWFPTVVTHHDAHSYWLERGYDWYRGEWHEKICLRCGQEEAAYQKTLYGIYLDNPAPTTHTPKPTEHFPLPNDWQGAL